MVPITPTGQEKVILFPKTIEYYQNELTRMLEEERYVEAARMLAFLLQCRSDDPHYKEEWRSLLDWLIGAFPEIAGILEADERESRDPGKEQDDEESEEALFKRHVKAKAAGDDRYAEKLLAMLDARQPPDKQLQALDQLKHMDRRTVGQPLKTWISESRLHPLVQFRGLQTLRAIGETGTLVMHKLGTAVTLTIEETPLRYEQFPDVVRSVADRCLAVLEADNPGLAEMADATWRDFAGFVYGTAVYEEMRTMDEKAVRIWAAALYRTVRETMFGGSDDDEPEEAFGLNADDSQSLNKAQHMIKLFAAFAIPGEM